MSTPHESSRPSRSLDQLGLPTLSGRRRSSPGGAPGSAGRRFRWRWVPTPSTRTALRLLAWIHVSAFVAWVAVGTGFVRLSGLAEDLLYTDPTTALTLWWQGPPCTPGTIRADGFACGPEVDVIVGQPPR